MKRTLLAAVPVALCVCAAVAVAAVAGADTAKSANHVGTRAAAASGPTATLSLGLLGAPLGDSASAQPSAPNLAPGLYLFPGLYIVPGHYVVPGLLRSNAPVFRLPSLPVNHGSATVGADPSGTALPSQVAVVAGSSASGADAGSSAPGPSSSSPSEVPSDPSSAAPSDSPSGVPNDPSTAAPADPSSAAPTDPPSDSPSPSDS